MESGLMRLGPRSALASSQREEIWQRLRNQTVTA